MAEKRKYTLKQARVLAGLSQEKAAAKIGITSNMLWMYEAARSSPTIHRALKIAEVYGLSIYDIDFPKDIKSRKKEA